MGSTKKVGPAGSFGARYGTVVRSLYAELKREMKRRHECPRCHRMAVTRLSVGIWHCRSCDLKFSGGAYVPFTKLGEAAKRSSRGPRLEPMPQLIRPQPVEQEKPRRRRRKEAKKEKEEET